MNGSLRAFKYKKWKKKNNFLINKVIQKNFSNQGNYTYKKELNKIHTT